MFSNAVAKLIIIIGLFLGTAKVQSAPPNEPSARVLTIEHLGATQAFDPQSGPIREMVKAGVTRFTGYSTVQAAWLSLISTQDVVGIKVHSAPGSTSGTRPMVVAALVESLLDAGISRSRIIIWDRRMVDLRLAGFDQIAEKHQVGIAAAMEEGYDSATFYPTPLLGKLVFGDLEFGQKGDGIGRNSYVTRLLTRRITRIINVTPLLNHNQAGVSGALYGLTMASVDNTLRFEDPERLATAIPEIYALPELADRVVLNIVDALICQYRGEVQSRLHYSAPLNQLWFSRDPVALDVLAIQELERNRSENKNSKSVLQIYANAALMDLGVADIRQIQRERIELKAKDQSGSQN